jgi:hypothetical protein
MFMSTPEKSTSTRDAPIPSSFTSTWNGLTIGIGNGCMPNRIFPPPGSGTSQATRCRSQAGSGCTVTSALGNSNGESL